PDLRHAGAVSELRGDARAPGRVRPLRPRGLARGRGARRAGRRAPGQPALVPSALAAFRRQGLGSASLSVTLENHRAYRLSRTLGFRLRKEFAAHAWVRPPARIELPA